MECIISREDSNVPVLLLVDIDQHFPLLEKICQSIRYDHHLINTIPVGKKKETVVPFVFVFNPNNINSYYSLFEKRLVFINGSMY